MDRAQQPELIFDSKHQGPIVGIRTISSPFRQLLFKAGDLCIDIQIQSRPGAEEATLMGQLLHCKKAPYVLRDVMVSIFRHGDLLDRQRTNDAGEFCFEVDEKQHLNLVFGIEQQSELIVQISVP